MWLNLSADHAGISKNPVKTCLNVPNAVIPYAAAAASKSKKRKKILRSFAKENGLSV